MINKRLKSLISIIILICITSVNLSTLVYASDDPFEEEGEPVVETVVEEEEDDKELKGPAALNSFLKGSPFLTDAWEKQKIDREDMVAMSLYMSSFIYPLIDNYNSAFYTGNSYGQQGRASTKLIFQNETRQTAIQEFINTIIGVQSPESQDDSDLSEERFIKQDGDSNHVYLKELLYGDPDVEIEEDNLLNFRLSDMEYVIGPEAKEVTVYNGENKKQLNLFYLALQRTLNSEFRNQFIQNLTEWVINNPEAYEVYVDDFGNLCINGQGDSVDTLSEDIEDPDEFIDNLKETIGDEDNELAYPLKNIIVLPNCMNSNIVSKLNLFSPFFLNDYLVASSNREGLYIADANYVTSKQNKISLVNTVQIGYQKVKTSGLKKVLNSLLFDIDNEETTYPYDYSVKSDIIYSYYDISGPSPLINYIFYDKNASSKYFNSSLNLNNLPVTSVVSLNKDENINYNATRMMYLNYLLMTKKFYDSKVQVNSELFTQDNIGESDIAASLFIDQNRKIDDLLTDLWNKNQNADNKVDAYLKTITALLVKVYDTIISVPFGSSYISSIPIVSTIYSKLKEYYLVIISVLLAIVVFLGITRGSLVKTVVKGILCMSLIIAIPTVFDKAIDLVTTLKYGLLEKSVNNWILSENIKYKGLNESSQYTSFKENISEITKPEELDNTLLYLKSKSPVIVNNVSGEINSEIQNSTLGSQLLKVLAGRTSEDNKIASFQDAFKRWEMIIPLWDYEGSREVSKSLQIENTSNVDKYIRKIDTENRTNSLNNYIGFIDISNGLSEASDYFSPYESTIVPIGESEDRPDASYASMEDYQEVVRQTRYKRQLNSDELSTIMGTDIEEVEDIAPELRTLYTLPKGIKGSFSIHNIFYLLDTLNMNTEDKYSSDASMIDKSSARDGLNETLNTYFKGPKDEIEDQDVSINHFNFSDGSKYDRNYGYFVLTENVAPYFYTVWYDMLGNLTSQEIGYALFGEVERDDELTVQKTQLNGGTINSRNSILMKQSKTIDYLDLRELFTNVVPYMSCVSKAAKDIYPSTAELGGKYEYYKDNRLNWVFESKWAEDLVDNFGQDMSNLQTFSEYALYENYNGDENRLNDLENLIQQFYIELTPLLEQLYTAADKQEIDKSILIRQLTILSTLKFNNIFGILGGNLKPKQIITESLPFDSLWIKFLQDNHYDNVGSNFLDMISRQNSTNKAFFNVVMAFILVCCYYYCLIVLLISTTLSVITIIYKALKNVINPNTEYIPYMTGCVVLIFKIAFLYIMPQFVVQISLTEEISKTLTKSTDPVFIYLIYSFIYVSISNFLIPTLLKPHVGQMHAFGIFNPGKVEDDIGGSDLIERVGGKITNFGKGVSTRFKGNEIPSTRIVPSSAFKRENIKPRFEKDIKPTSNNSTNAIYKAQAAVSNYQENKNNKAISEINAAIAKDKATGSTNPLGPTPKGPVGNNNSGV